MPISFFMPWVWIFSCFGESWQFNKDYESPTVSPSLLVTNHKKNYRCHSFIREGKIQFLNDCTHKLAGQTVDLPDYDGPAEGGL